MEVYYVIGWYKHYVKSQAAQSECLPWVAQSTNLAHDTYISIIERKDGRALYGIYRVLIAVAARCVPAGVLVERNGTPFTPASLFRKTHIPKREIERALPILIHEEKVLAVSATVEEAVAAVEASKPAWNNGREPQSGPPAPC